ncbi:hypothetical protein CARUB_v10006874mg, partial [Capsella rubella]
NEGHNICEDKISALPEDLLIYILLFLPTKDVVNTMFLSKRWRSIWKMVPSLEYIESKDSERASVWWFLDKSLQQHKAPILESFSIVLDERCPIDADINKWIANAVYRRVRMLKLILKWSAAPIGLPASLYTCETLVELYLSREILLDVPSSVCLTSLRKLELSEVVYKDAVSHVRLLSSCPVLENFYVRRIRNDNVTNFIVEVPSLKKLSYKKEQSDKLSDVLRDIGASLVIDCPVLKRLDFTDTAGSSCTSQNMPCLDGLVLVSPIWHPDEKFLIPFSSITELILCVNQGMVKCCSAVYFPRLTVLRIFPFDTDWMEPLQLLLKSSPILKHLSIHNNRNHPPKKILVSWNQPNSLPKCVSSSLEVFKWPKYGGGTEEKEFATYILGNSECLKYAEFGISCNVDLEERNKMREELNSMPRVLTSNLKILN